jgi:hypothetical protein
MHTYFQVDLEVRRPDPHRTSSARVGQANGSALLGLFIAILVYLAVVRSVNELACMQQRRCFRPSAPAGCIYRCRPSSSKTMLTVAWDLLAVGAGGCCGAP